MNNFFVMKRRFVGDDIDNVVEVPKNLHKPCRTSEFQYIDHCEVELKINLEQPDQVLNFTDFVLADGFIPLVSPALRDEFERLQVDNLFYKRVYLVADAQGISKQYWLALPPRIDCVDIEDRNNKFGFDFCVSILPERVGNYHIFRLKGDDNNKKIGNSEIIVDAVLKDRLQGLIDDHKLMGIKFESMKGR